MRCWQLAAGARPTASPAAWTELPALLSGSAGGSGSKSGVAEHLWLASRVPLLLAARLGGGHIIFWNLQRCHFGLQSVVGMGHHTQAVYVDSLAVDISFQLFDHPSLVDGVQARAAGGHNAGRMLNIPRGAAAAQHRKPASAAGHCAPQTLCCQPGESASLLSACVASRIKVQGCCSASAHTSAKQGCILSSAKQGCLLSSHLGSSISLYRMVTR